MNRSVGTMPARKEKLLNPVHKTVRDPDPMGTAEITSATSTKILSLVLQTALLTRPVCILQMNLFVRLKPIVNGML